MRGGVTTSPQLGDPRGLSGEAAVGVCLGGEIRIGASCPFLVRVEEAPFQVAFGL